MSCKMFHKSCIASTLATVSLVAAAATSYITPWYANPALRSRTYVNANAFTPVDLKVGADGERVVVVTSGGPATNLRVFDAQTLDRTGSVALTNIHLSARSTSSLGVGATPRLAARGHDLLCIDSGNGAAAGISLESRRWVGRYAPDARTFSAAPDATSFALDSEGALWSNATGAGRTGLIVKRSLSGSAYVEVDTVDTGLAAVDAMAVYAVNGTNYAFAAAQGKVVRVNLSTKAVATLVDDTAHLDDAVAVVRMSHTDYFRPRLYVLLVTGDIAVYYLDEEATTASWSKTVTNESLLDIVQCPYGHDATICAFDVRPDGGAAYFGYRPTDGAVATGPCYVATVRNYPPRWIYYAKGSAGNPSTESATYNCITDGKWVLRCDVSGKNISIGVGTQNEANCGNAWDGDYMGEYLDLSNGHAYSTGGTEYNIVAAKQWALGYDSAGRQPRVIVHTTLLNDFWDRTKGWSAVEEVVIDSTYLTTIGAWTGLNKNVKRVVINAPNVTSLGNYALNNNNNALYYPGTKSDFGDFTLTKAQTIGLRAVGCYACKGILDLPAAKTICQEAFHQCRYMTEARLGTAANSLECVSNGAFTANWFASGSLKRVVMGGVEGFTICGNAFDNQPLEEVVFTGGRPTFTSNPTFQDKAARTIIFAVPRGNANWNEIIDDPAKVTTRLTDLEKQAFAAAHPGKTVPFGVVDKSVFSTKYDQYIAYNETVLGGGCKLTIDRDTFFDDVVEVVSDGPVCEDGTYTPGTTVTIAARPGTTGIFRKWYGDVPRDDMDVRTNATLTLTLTNNVWLYARFVHPWTLSANKKTASNGNFTINCAVVDESRRTLKVGKDNTYYSIYADDDVGQGILDLGGPVRLEGDAAPWTFVDMPWGGCTWTAPLTVSATGLITPGTVTQTSMTGQFLHTADDSQSYRLLIMDEPVMGKSIGGWTMATQYLLTKFILELPGLTQMTGDGALWGIPMTETKFDWWNLDNVMRIDSGTLAGSDGGNVGSWNYWAPARGTLSLPSMRKILPSGERGSPIRLLYNVEGIVLGGKDKATTLTNLCDAAFSNDRSLKSLTLHASADITVGAHPFSSNYTPKEIVFTGPAPLTETALANLLSYVTAAETKPVKVYASLFQDGWTTVPYIDRNPTAAERAEAPGERLIGVYRGGAAAPLGKALVIFRKSRFDAPATVFIVR